AAAAGLAALEIVLKEDLVKNAERVGAMMLTRLQAMKEKHRVVGEVRGKGLLLGIELVKDRRSKEPLGREVTRALYQECLRRDLDPARRSEAVARLPGARWFDSVDDLLGVTGLDFVDVCTPPSSHAPLIGRALEHGLHVLCEKPLVRSPAELDLVRRLAAARR